MHGPKGPAKPGLLAVRVPPLPGSGRSHTINPCLPVRRYSQAPSSVISSVPASVTARRAA